MKILIVKLSAIGDVIHTLPALNALRRHYPQARITWLVETAAADLLVGHPALDRVMISHRKHWIRGMRSGRRMRHFEALFTFVRRLRAERYDLVLDFQALLKSSLWVLLARSPRKIGFGKGMEHMEKSYLFLTERVPPVSMEIHALERNLLMLAPLGIHCREAVYRLPVGTEDRQAVESLLQAHGLGAKRPLVSINPMAKWPTKLWDPAKFSQLADRMAASLGAEICFTGGTEDRPAVARIMADMRFPAVNLAGRTTLKQLAALYARSDVLVSTDTGPMHLGAAVGIPVVALFGPTAPWRTGPYGKAHRVIRHPVGCAPCFKRQCDTGRCMAAIDVNAVFEAVRSVIGE